MMTTPEQVAIRAVFVYPDKVQGTEPPTHRLLSDLGHEVTTTGTMDDALRILEAGRVDLLILDEDSIPARGSDRPFKERVMEQLGTLDSAQQPREVAIFANRAEGSVAEPSRRMGAPKVHVFFKPLHMHGLLHVLRHLESKLTQ